jgi:UDP-N-acetylmuramoyl-tripeptide--D-alanyl-D-alanine ligase
MSMLWTADELIAATGGAMARRFDADYVSIDSRSIGPEQLFVALVGENGDGHRFVANALAAGAAGALVHHVPEGLEDAPLLVVKDTFQALHDLGRFARARFTGRLVAVTGSVGKTTVKEMLRCVLSAQGATQAAEASYNNHWGVPLTLARIPADTAFAVIEIGMNHAGEIAPLARLARPHVAVISTVGTAHVGNLGSVEAIADEKATIAEGLEPGGTLLLPADSPLCERMRARTSARVESFGTARHATHRLLHALPDSEGTDLALSIDGQELSFRLRAPGLHMAMNALAALAAAHLLGADVLDGAASLAEFVPGVGRGARREIAWPGGSILLLDESYNASTSAVRAALALLGMVPATRRVAVLGDMLEMGDAGPAEHLSLAPDVAAHADLLFTCGPLMQHLHDAMPMARRGAHAGNSASLAPLLLSALRPGDAVLVKGSLGSRMKTIVGAIEAASPTPGQPKDQR